ncbi:MAG TPA: TadE family protein [Planctomycetota bacterium]|nr:TadE family protein [Planctomycetota bacterium]
MSKLAELHSSTRAQALAEWAVVFPVQLFITLGVIQLALVLVARNVVSYSAHMAARAELVGADPHKAAAMICSPITWSAYGERDVRIEPDFGLTVKGQKEKDLLFPRPEWQGPMPDRNTGVPSSSDDTVLPGWGTLDHSALALLKTHTYATSPRDSQNDYVEVQVLYEFELIIPAVNWVFSTHRIAGHPHLGLLRTARLPKQWVNDDSGVEPHDYIKTVDTRSGP